MDVDVDEWCHEGFGAKGHVGTSAWLLLLREGAVLSQSDAHYGWVMLEGDE